jgi:hypothetical protein
MYATKPIAAAGATNAETNGNCTATPAVAHQLTLKQATVSGRTCTITATLKKITPIKLRASTTKVMVSGTSLVVDTPAGTQQNDLMFVLLGFNAGSPTAPSGWTLTSTSGASGQDLYTYRRIAGASEPLNYTWTFSTSLTVAAWEGTYIGVDTANPLDATVGSGTNGTTHTTLSITASYAGDLIVAGYSLNGVATFSTPTGMTAEGVVSGGSGPGISLAIFDTSQVSSGTVTAKTTTTSISAQDADNVFAFKPASANTTTLGSGTAVSTSVSGPTLLSTGSFATSAVTFADGDRLSLEVTAPNDTNCGSRLSFDATTTPSKLTVATIVPEGVLGLLLIAPALPFGARWWKRRRP